MSARSKRNTKIEDEDAANTVKCDNTDVKKDVTVTGAAYKYLTWREKDRRRRFREEWKHLWLVIPHGLYEVMCLVCHKVMTQRKVDTIKRHTVRRHAELLGMSQVERENLFNELMRRFNMQEVTKYNSSTYTPSKSPKKLNEPCDSTFLRNPHGFSNVNELNGVSKNCLLNTSICLDGRISELHNIGTVSTSSNCLIGNSLNFQPLLNARNKNSHSRHIQSVKPTRRCAINSFPYGNKFLPRTPQNEDTIENLNNLPSKPVTNRYNSLEFITNSFASETSVPKTSNNFHNPSDYFIFGNKIKSPTLNSKSIPTDHSLLTPMIPPLLPISLEFPVSTSFAASTSGTQSVNNINSHGSMCFQSLPSSNPSKLSSSFQLLESFPIFRNLNKLSTLSQHNNNPMNCNNGGIGFNSNNADNNSPSVEDHENFHFDSPVKQNVVNNQNNLFNLKLGSAATADINNTSVSSYVNDRHANTQQSTSSDVSHNSRCTSFSSSCSHNVPNLTTSPSLQLMMNYLVTALANTSKTLNQEVYDMAFENLAKIVSNISSNTEKTCIFPTHLLNPNLMKNYSTDLNTCHKDGIPTSKREETVTNLSNQTHFQQFHQPQSSKDYNTKNKSSPHCNKFTISSLLNTDDHLTLKRTVKAATRVNQLSPDIPKKNEISQTVKHINSSLQYDYEKSNVEQISPCTSYLLCNLKSGNTDPYELNTKFSSSNLNQNNTHIFHNDSFDNEKEKRSFLTNLFDPPKTFDSNKISEQNSNLNETYQMYKDIFEGNSHSNGQIQLSSFLNPNILQSQDVGTFEAYMKFFYLELLRQHYDNIPKINHSTNTGSRSEPSPASEGSIRTNVITYSDEHNKSSVND
ncbi:unnamed protein product [Heterobilharzia americana]|nr:unnamed protein product [Heterobilharzia americana]